MSTHHLGRTDLDHLCSPIRLRCAPVANRSHTRFEILDIEEAFMGTECRDECTFSLHNRSCTVADTGNQTPRTAPMAPGPLLASWGNKLATSSSGRSHTSPIYVAGRIFGRTDRKVHNLTNKQSRSCHSLRTFSLGSRKSITAWITWGCRRRSLVIIHNRKCCDHCDIG